VNSRNGYRAREWDTRAGTIEVAIPKLRTGSYFPDWLLERRRRAEVALISWAGSILGLEAIACSSLEFLRPVLLRIYAVAASHHERHAVNDAAVHHFPGRHS
jgi:hypothetical protein